MTPNVLGLLTVMAAATLTGVVLLAGARRDRDDEAERVGGGVGSDAHVAELRAMRADLAPVWARQSERAA